MTKNYPPYESGKVLGSPSPTERPGYSNPVRIFGGSIIQYAIQKRRQAAFSVFFREHGEELKVDPYEALPEPSSGSLEPRKGTRSPSRILSRSERPARPIPRCSQQEHLSNSRCYLLVQREHVLPGPFPSRPWGVAPRRFQ